MMKLARKNMPFIIWARSLQIVKPDFHSWRRLIVFSMDCSLSMAVHDLSYYFVDFKDGSNKVYIWEAYLNRKTFPLADATVWIWHPVRDPKAIKGGLLFDYLAHQPVNDYEWLKFDFPDEDIMEIKDYEILSLTNDLNEDLDGKSCSMVPSITWGMAWERFWWTQIVTTLLSQKGCALIAWTT